MAKVIILLSTYLGIVKHKYTVRLPCFVTKMPDWSAKFLGT